MGLFSGLKGHREQEELLYFGEILLQHGIVDAQQLSQATERQKSESEAKGVQVSLGRVLVDMGFTTEKELLDTLNSNYDINASSVDEDLQELLEETRAGRFGRMRIPIRVKLSVTLAVFLLAVMLVLSYFILERQANNLYQESVKAGKISLGYFTTESKIPLLNDDTLRLNSLIKEVTRVEGLVYAIIVGRNGMIKAHNDLSRVGKALALPGRIGPDEFDKETTYFKRQTEEGHEILNMSAPVHFKDKPLGRVHVGISLDFIQERIEQEKFFIYMVTIAFFLIGMAVAGLLGANFSRPILRLVDATKEISSGNYSHKLNFRRKDEFGDLGKAFNFMSHELWLKSIMRESFGRYVSTTIRDLILADPESVWLKGTKSEATIMFADVRGFTKYSEAHDPAVIVEHLNEFFDIAAKHIQENDGYIDKFIGDEVLAVFGGIPDYEGDHAANAVRAAWAMQRELLSKKDGDNPVLGRVGASINSGEVVSGNIGSDVRMEYTVIGDSVNVASRLNALAPGGRIVISESTYSRVKDFVATQMLQPQMVKGKTKPLQPYGIIRVLNEGEGPAPPPKPYKGEGVAAPPPPKAGPAAPPAAKTRPASEDELEQTQEAPAQSKKD